MRSHLKGFRGTLIGERGFRRGGNSANGETTTGFTSRHPTPPPNAARLFGSAGCKTSNRAGNACGGDPDQRGLSAHRAHPTSHREDPGPLESAGMRKPSGPGPFRKASPSGSSLSTRDGADGLHLPFGMGIWLHRLDSGPSSRTSGPEDAHPPVGALDYAAFEEGRIFLRHPSTHAEGEAPREGASQGQETPQKAKKGALRATPDFRLCFGDESNFNLYPYLTRLWHRKGRQPRVPTPGKNRKLYVFGAIDLKSGKFFYNVQPTNNQWGSMVIVQQLLKWARMMRIPVILVWDNARTHRAKRLQAYMNQLEVKRWIRIFWLSTYSPDLNDIERLWRHLKRTGVANHLFSSPNEFRAHLLKLLAKVNRNKKEPFALVFRTRKAA